MSICVIYFAHRSCKWRVILIAVNFPVVCERTASGMRFINHKFIRLSRLRVGTGTLCYLYVYLDVKG